MISIIVAVASNGAIGKNGDLLWHIKDDLKYFKEITLGHTVLMGRKTWESLPKKPLPNRRNIVITKNKNYSANGAELFLSLEAALNSCGTAEEVFCIGGGTIYEQILPFCNKLYVTKVEKDFDADTFFPKIDPNLWKIEKTAQKNSQKDEASGLTYKFEVYSRLKSISRKVRKSESRKVGKSKNRLTDLKTK
jgi:dihydrofolate reductase